MWLACQYFGESLVEYMCYLLLGYHWPNSDLFLLFEIWVIMCEPAMPTVGSSTWKEERKKWRKGTKVVAEWGQEYQARKK